MPPTGSALRPWAGVLLFWAAVSSALAAPLENLGRGTVALQTAPGRVYIGWRLLAGDPPDIAFNLYRSLNGGAPVRLNPQPLRRTTDFVDETAPTNGLAAYFVRPILKGVEQPMGRSFELNLALGPRPYLAIPLQTPPGYQPNDAAPGDLDGDGEYEIVLHQAGRGRDNSQRGQTDPPILEAYKLDGTRLWRIHLGRNIREGAHYTQFLVFDFDGDGRAEVVCKTADGTVDGAGQVIGDAQADHRSPDGYVLTGPEFLTVFDGRTGRALVTTNYLPPRGEVAAWGDNYGNRVDRFLAAVACLDGQRPSFVLCRGYYTRTVLVAWDWRDGRLTRRWTFDSHDGPPALREYAGQGNHNLSVADVDGDGRDEIIYGACTMDDDGRGLYTTGLGHGDALHVSDLDPTRPGLEVFGIHEKARHPHGVSFRDARTGKILWSKSSPDVGRGLAIDIDPRHPGAECWAAGAGLSGLWNARGELISERRPRSCNFAVWWDADPLRELLDRNVITKWNWETATESTLLTAEGCVSNNGTKATPCLSADLLGDWREEVLWRTPDGRELRLYVSTIPATFRLPTLMQDRQYRLAVAWQNVGYNQPPHPSFWLKPPE
ncbi:rhamnogalacturonan lyase [Fontisphaera persica]|uniref:rhamnogalacturonan lyase n=1 Tax=Fontisphaera persica TaxID=2974023 RepID=UPI0024BF2A31|nr:rhamnogalacturonan lyase [Fontisphaera persica]WCJ59285.1 rhamnogalacturonan lyase [Fontisphaera persica]